VLINVAELDRYIDNLSVPRPKMAFANPVDPD
jgi:hypothetical protein